MRHIRPLRPLPRRLQINTTHASATAPRRELLDLRILGRRHREFPEERLADFQAPRVNRQGKSILLGGVEIQVQSIEPGLWILARRGGECDVACECDVRDESVGGGLGVQRGDCGEDEGVDVLVERGVGGGDEPEGVAWHVRDTLPAFGVVGMRGILSCAYWI